MSKKKKQVVPAAVESPEKFRELADELATLIQSISTQEASQEAEKNNLDKKYECLLSPLKNRVEELEAGLKKYLKSKDAQAALFDEGNRSGHSTLATFGYRDTPDKVAALSGTKDAAIQKLVESGNTEYLIVVEQPDKITLIEDKLKLLPPEKLAELGFRLTHETKFFFELRNAVITERKSSKA